MDKYYQSIKDECSYVELLEAGYIKENYVSRHRFSPVTPLPDVEKFSKNKKNVVLLSTGSFAPIHDGHIEKLEVSKKHLENLGMNVVAGYLSPSHDDYVLGKVQDERYNIFERINFIHQKIDECESDWLFLSPWEALWNGEPKNITTVMDYLKEYICYHVKDCPEFEIYYVYGSDNHTFGRTFKYHGKGICVERFGYPLFEYRNVINISKNKYAEINSTAIRKKVIDKNGGAKNGVYLLRDDFKRSLPISVLDKISQKESDDFIKGITDIIKKHNIVSKDVRLMNEEKEASLIKDIDLSDYISLDVYHGDNKARISRLFQMSSGQVSPVSLICNKSFNNNGGAECCIFDDDSVSGKTLSFFEKQFNVTIIKKVLLSEMYKEAEGIESIVDVADIRDFLFGAQEGGLLVSFGSECTNMGAKTKKTMKCPYIFPFINPVTRLNIETSKVIKSSFDILLLNENIYKNKNILIKDFENEDLIKFSKILSVSEDENIIVLINKIKEILNDAEE
jgi:nicotinic acid mononucleotide adenylyltransferase